ncbi:hypothetical protein [Vogesella oryzae]|uniref:hypothetical protein n=1 Tax=Vogesella oryzae TaxID=1735285 RepID=UPI00158222E7|nr:hypothetical protein [Vogesella oryzae]
MSDVAHTLHQLYRRARALQPAGAITVLQLTDGHCGFASGHAIEPDSSSLLPLGCRQVAALFRHAPPTGMEIERAIMLVEDTLAPVRPTLAAGSQLYCADAGVRTLAAHAGVSGDGELWLSTEQLEYTFGRFAEVVQGRPAAMEGLPVDADFAAELLIVRELTHHLGFAGIRLLP